MHHGGECGPQQGPPGAAAIFPGGIAFGTNRYDTNNALDRSSRKCHSPYDRKWRNVRKREPSAGIDSRRPKTPEVSGESAWSVLVGAITGAIRCGNAGSRHHQPRMILAAITVYKGSANTVALPPIRRITVQPEDIAVSGQQPATVYPVDQAASTHCRLCISAGRWPRPSCSPWRWRSVWRRAQACPTYRRRHSDRAPSAIVAPTTLSPMRATRMSPTRWRPITLFGTAMLVYPLPALAGLDQNAFGQRCLHPEVAQVIGASFQ